MNETRPPAWDAETLWQSLEPLLPGLSVEVVARCDSTNTRLLERARQYASARDRPITRPGDLEEPRPTHGRRAGDVQPCLLVAEHQTDGRGRLGRDWLANAGASLTFSLALPLTPQDWSGLSLAVGLALAQALEPQPDSNPPRVALKWPNDLWLRDTAAASGGRKLGGVLIETIAIGSQRMAVIGIGLNVRPQVLEGLSSGYACVQELWPEATAPALLHRVAGPLVQAVLDFQRGGFAPLVAAYASRDLLRGQAVSTSQAGLPQGLATGVDASGALCIEADGVTHRLVSGEVSIRPLAAGPAPG
jgi:BirA family biotin operon repressor/biotin-[acetyl-CoA-carboxylase] ligase